MGQWLLLFKIWDISRSSTRQQLVGGFISATKRILQRPPAVRSFVGIRILMEIASSLQPARDDHGIAGSVKQPEMMFTLIYLVLAALNHTTQTILLFFYLAQSALDSGN